MTDTKKRTYDEDRVARAMVFSLDSSAVYNALLELDVELKDPMLKMIQEAHHNLVLDGDRVDIHGMVSEFIRLGGNEVEMIDRLHDDEKILVTFAFDIANSIERLNRGGNVNKYAESLGLYAKGEIGHKELMSSIAHPTYEPDAEIWDLSDIFDAVDAHDESDIIETGFSKFDRFHKGMEKSRVTIIAARPGVGKTDFAMHVIRHNLKAGKNIVFISVEMDAREIGYRLGRAENPGRYGKSGTLDGIKVIQSWPGKLTVYGKADPTAAYASARCEMDTDLVVVDYLQIMRATTVAGQYEQTTELSNDLRKAAKRSSAAWMVLSQLSRETGDDKTRPTLKALRGSGAIEQDAFAVVFLYMPNGEVQYGADQDLVLVIAKNRGGPKGEVGLICDRGNSRWREG